MKGKMKSRIAKLRARLKGKRAEGLAELNAELDMDRHENEIVDGRRSRVRKNRKKNARQETTEMTDNGQIAR